MSNITSKKLDQFAADFKQAMKTLEQKHNVTVHLGNCRYNESEGRYKLTVIGAQADGSTLTKGQLDFNANIRKHGLKESDFGREFTYQGKIFKIVGYRPRAKMYSIVGQNETGTKYVFPLQQVKRNFIDKPQSVDLDKINQEVLSEVVPTRDPVTFAKLSKKQRAQQIFDNNPHKNRAGVIEKFMSELDMSKACASTYYANAKKASKVVS